ncbi:MAG: tetratricopeptide repeat protein, partial [Gammaproteobacteria bacterium]|nr:tetratricopeptide repeat protein [Gammaproteobacteria bacterium]
MRKWILCTLTPFLGSLAFASPQPSFEVRLGDDGQTLGDMRPVFIDVSAKRLPDIPLAEVIRRYKRLFDAAEEPSVRIDALHRLIQLQDVAGERLELTIEEENQLYARAIDSYNRLIDGRHPGFEPDELLYHAARAHAFVGEEDASARRLEELVSRHPQSSYLAEARFRLGERLFNRQDYAGAERHYRAVLDAQEP